MAPSTTFTAIYTNSTSLSPSFSLTKDVPTTSTSSPMTTSDRAKYLHELRQIAATFQDDINRELTQRMEEDNKRAAAASGGKSTAEEEEAAKEEENYGEEVVEEDE
ncbi:EKC/KEOPS complex, subunit Gon7 [Copromyces sp. CBS 386.78]|nr:EKC/KEOPS complex, subunit Gon7 [Copromyces sp. CBS 386.78]